MNQNYPEKICGVSIFSVEVVFVWPLSLMPIETLGTDKSFFYKSSDSVLA